MIEHVAAVVRQKVFEAAGKPSQAFAAALLEHFSDVMIKRDAQLKRIAKNGCELLCVGVISLYSIASVDAEMSVKNNELFA